MFKINNFLNTDSRVTQNRNIITLDQLGMFTVIEYRRDLSVNFSTAKQEYFASQMGVRRKQLVCNLSTPGASGVTLQAGAMQWMAGTVQVQTGIKSAGDLIGKAFAGHVTGESAVKPEYTGSGIVVCEPTYKHLILTSPNDWDGGVVIDDGMFLACENTVKQSIQRRRNMSSAIAGGKGLFNLKLTGTGAVQGNQFCEKIFKTLCIDEKSIF